MSFLCPSCIGFVISCENETERHRQTEVTPSAATTVVWVTQRVTATSGGALPFTVYDVTSQSKAADSGEDDDDDDDNS